MQRKGVGEEEGEGVGFLVSCFWFLVSGFWIFNAEALRGRGGMKDWFLVSGVPFYDRLTCIW